MSEFGWYLPMLGTRALSPLIAQVESFRRAGGGFQPNQNSFEAGDWVWVAVLLGGPLVVLLLWRSLQRVRRRLEHSSPDGLFLELCRAHNLRWRQRLRLWRMARERSPASPAILFVSPDLFSLDEAKSSDRDSFQDWRQVLFAETPPTNGGPGAA
jgi:hypothetical protein